MGLQDSQAEWLHLRKPIKTYKHKNNHEHNNTHFFSPACKFLLINAP